MGINKERPYQRERPENSSSLCNYLGLYNAQFSHISHRKKYQRLSLGEQEGLMLIREP